MTPQMFDVLVNSWVLIITNSVVKPSFSPRGTISSSSLIEPLRISPTSKATMPPDFVTRNSSARTSDMISFHLVKSLGTDI